MKANDVLFFFSQKYNGNYDKIYQAIKDKEPIKQSELEQSKRNFTGNFITILDDNYPEGFKYMYRPPLVLYYLGDIRLLDNLDKAIAVVGSRDATKYGLNMTEEIVSDLIKENYTIVSGMARGIDAKAHEVALASNGKTIAVLGSGIDYPYPKSNTPLYYKIVEHGLVLSEYPGNIAPSKEYFPERNRIVAALTNGVLVVESKIRSGTFITINYALSRGSDIYCVPTKANENSGCNRLIKDGAYLVESAKDIIDVWKKVSTKEK
ncbi:MAG: DNA-protecting protein DprA [Erysipelotrichaceae bacterium]|nr:DNA-protecting protein DprA [Erysipelotrichaceae bacterium]